MERAYQLTRDRARTQEGFPQGERIAFVRIEVLPREDRGRLGRCAVPLWLAEVREDARDRSVVGDEGDQSHRLPLTIAHKYVNGERDFSVAAWAGVRAGRLDPCADPAIARPAWAVTAARSGAFGARTP